MATDADENDMLTYTLWWGDSSSNLSKTDITATGRSGQSVTLEKSGLSNDTRYWFKVVVSDSIDEATSGEGNEKTYCKGEYCNGVSYTNVPCTKCDSNHKVKCPSCDGIGFELCRKQLTATQSRNSFAYDIECRGCGKTIRAFTTCYDNHYTCSVGHTHEWTPNGQQNFCTTSCANSYASILYCGESLGFCGDCNRGSIICPKCGGTGQMPITMSCSAHSVSGGHYYCTSSSHHGNSVVQYHK